jgi:hypothetical protein
MAASIGELEMFPLNWTVREHGLGPLEFRRARRRWREVCATMRGEGGGMRVLDDLRADAAKGSKVACAVADALRIAVTMTFSRPVWEGTGPSGSPPAALRQGHVVLHFCISTPHRAVVERELEEQLFADLRDPSKTFVCAHVHYWRRIVVNVLWFTCDGFLERLLKKFL